MKQTVIGSATDNNGNGQPSWPVHINQEDLMGVKHGIYLISSEKAYDLKDIVVPPQMYFVMGIIVTIAKTAVFGFVPEHDIVGKAIRIALSLGQSK